VRTAVLVLAVVGIVYGALVSLVQPDFKKLVAYSSVSHLGFVMLGIFALTVQSVQGALMVMINHGLSTGALFFLIGMIYERRHTRLIESYGGIARVVPMFAAMLTLVSLSSIGVPGTNGFVGEFLIMLGLWKSTILDITTTVNWNYIATMLAGTGVIFAAVYLLWMIQRVFFGKLTNDENKGLTDLSWREIGLFVPLLALMVFMGVYPRPFLEQSKTSVTEIQKRVMHQAGGEIEHAEVVEPHE